MTERSCQSCEYYKGDDMLGECHIRSSADGWPARYPGDWCGEWKPETSAIARARARLVRALPPLGWVLRRR